VFHQTKSPLTPRKHNNYKNDKVTEEQYRFLLTNER